MDNELSYKPSAYYYRRALRAAPTKEAAIDLGMHLVEEIERHKQWIREHGLVPPKWLVMQDERDEKSWGLLVSLATEASRAQPPSDRAPIAATFSE